jgi:hypothetical protein
MTPESGGLLTVTSGGKPYAESGDEWPRCAGCKRPLDFLWQILYRGRSRGCPCSFGRIHIGVPLLDRCRPVAWLPGEIHPGSGQAVRDGVCGPGMRLGTAWPPPQRGCHEDRRSFRRRSSSGTRTDAGSRAVADGSGLNEQSVACPSLYVSRSGVLDSTRSSSRIVSVVLAMSYGDAIVSLCRWRACRRTLTQTPDRGHVAVGGRGRYNGMFRMPGTRDRGHVSYGVCGRSLFLQPVRLP